MGSTAATAVSRTNPCLGTGSSSGRTTDAPKKIKKRARLSKFRARRFGGRWQETDSGGAPEAVSAPRGPCTHVTRGPRAARGARARAPPTPLNCGASPRPTPRTPTPRPDNRSRVGASDWPYGGSRGADVKAGSAPPSRHPRSACRVWQPDDIVRGLPECARSLEQRGREARCSSANSRTAAAAGGARESRALAAEPPRVSIAAVLLRAWRRRQRYLEDLELRSDYQTTIRNTTT